MSNKPASLLKRFTASMIDVILIIIIYSLFRVITQPMINDKYDADTKYERVLEIDTQEKLNNNIAIYKQDNNGETYLFEYTSDYYIELRFEEYKKENYQEIITDKKEEELKTIYSNEYSENVRKYMENLQKNEEYGLLVSELNAIGSTQFLFGTFLGEFIFLFIVPFFMKDKQTFGQKLLGLLVLTKHEINITYKHVLIRFLVMFVIETIAVHFIIGTTDVISLVLAELVLIGLLILLTPNRVCLHDMLSGTKLVEKDRAKIFSSIEEKRKFDEKYVKKAEKKDPLLGAKR